MTHEEYNERKWELFTEWRTALPHFKSVANNRKTRLIRLIAEHKGVSYEEAENEVNEMRYDY